MPDVKRCYEVLYRNKPAWVVGEQDVDAAKRRVLLTDVTQSKELYPGSFRGKVISIRPEGHPWTEKDLACPTRSLATLELTGEEVSALGSKKLKVDETGRTLLSISFEDRYGATAANLKRIFPYATVTTEDDERAEIDTVVEADQAEQLAYEDAMRAWKGDAAKAIVGLIVFSESKPKAPVPSPVHEPVFALEAVRLKRKLSKTIVHSGAGLYEVGPTKTYSTIQSALDQLWTDQGSATFTASQYIRIFAGTYDENVTPNAGLNPDEVNGYYLFIEGDPADSRANVIIAPSGGSYGILIQCDQCTLQHLTVGGTPNNTMLLSTTGCLLMRIEDCVFSGGRTAIDIRYSAQIKNSAITVTANFYGMYLAYNRGSVLVESCRITGPGKATSTYAGAYIRIGDGIEIVGSVISGFQEGAYVGEVNVRGRLARVVQNTFHDCNYGVRPSAWGEGNFNWQLVNNIFKDVDYPVQVNIWPEETTTQIGANFVLRNNCFHGYTAFAYGPAAATKTYAQFIALNQVDASGDLDATDPLLTDPGAGDFTLQAASPCIRRAPPAGVIRDVNGDLYATDRTDIGSVSSGTSSAAPGISAVSVSGNDYTATVTPGGAPNVRVRLMTRGGIEEDEEQRLGAGNVVLTATSAGDHTLVAWGCDAAGNPIGEPSAPFIVSVPSPVSSGGSMLRRTPHVVTLKRPAVVRDTDNNVATRDYDNPTKTVSIRCLFQTRGGEVSVGDEGQIVPFDSMVYTIEKDVEVNDRIEVALGFYTGNFLVVAVEPKGRVGGVYSHNQVSLQKDGVR